MAGKALKDTELSDEKRIKALENSLENIINEYADLIELVEGKGNEFSHGMGGQICDYFKVKKSRGKGRSS